MSVPILRYMDRLWKNHYREHDRARREIDNRLLALNNLRENVLTREEYNTAHQSLEDKLTVLTDRFNVEVAGRRQGGNALWGYFVAGATILIAIASIVVVVLVHG